MNRNFDFWFNEVADMPEKDDKGWIDNETGLRFDPAINYLTGRKKSQAVHSEKTLSARKVASFFGGKALTGTAKQVKWAEDIRAEKVKDMSEEQAILCCAPDGLMKSAKAWIENRNKSATEIAQFVETCKAIREEYREKHAAGDEQAVRTLAEKYNALTASWGFQ